MVEQARNELCPFLSGRAGRCWIDAGGGQRPGFPARICASPGAGRQQLFGGADTFNRHDFRMKGFI